MIPGRMPLSDLERRLRVASRAALYCSLVLVTAATYGAIRYLDRALPVEQTERWIEHDYPHDPLVLMLQHYSQIDTSEATGNEVEGARFLAAQLAAAGIPSEIEVIGGKRANLYARLDGRDPHPLVLHNHIDVKDVDPKEWIHPPFAGTLELPWIFGRGVFDMKSIAVAQLMAMVDLKRSGLPLRRSVLFLATGDEEDEDDSRFGAQWVIRSRPQLVHSFWALLSEGGTVEARSREDVKYWGTEVGQKHFAAVRVCSDRRDRLEALQRSLKERGFTETDLHLLPQISEILKLYGPTRDSRQMRELVERPAELLGDIAAFRQVPNYVQSMLRNEAVPFDIQPAPGGGFELYILLHMLPGVRAAEVFDQLLPPWMMQGLSTSIDEPPGSPMPSPTDHPAFRAIVDTIHADYPDFPAGPFFLPWTATDSRFFRAAGVPCYGFSPFFIMSTDTYQVDRQNERLGLPGFLQGVELYRKLVRRLVL
jgi:acetylornithine deacetylase/succinyl-diaminopimelate desuccinylase-like protein